MKFTNIPDHVVDHLLKVGEIFLASGSFTIGDRELGKYVEHLDGTLDAIEGKEGCNWGHGLSAAIKQGSLEKTVIASLFHSGLLSGSPFFVKKTRLHNLLPSLVIVHKKD